MLNLSGKKIAVLLLIVTLGFLALLVLPFLERIPPVVSVERLEEQGSGASLGNEPFNVSVSDEGTGLLKVRIYLMDAYGESVLLEKKYEKGMKKDLLSVSIDHRKLGIKSGPSKIFVEVTDRFTEGFFPGNKTVFSRDVTLDFVPPTIEELSSMNYVRHGGSGAIIYRTSSDATVSGVSIKDLFFPGYPGHFSDPLIHIAFFAYPHDFARGEDMKIVASDSAGNKSWEGISYSLLRSSYVDDRISVSRWFMEKKISPLYSRIYGRKPEAREGLSALETAFLKINRDIRAENDRTIYEVGTVSRGEILWEGKFDQLPNSKVGATFADRREYLMDDRVIDKQYHLGYDLSVTRRYPVTASNAGVVVFTDFLGIYGNTVIIDHGMGLMTLYSHLSSIDVSVGQSVTRKDIIGKTGTTGLAVGDHLHFGVYVHGIAVRPLEWWDSKWIKDNIVRKIDSVRKNY